MPDNIKISEFLLKDFIQVVAYDNYASLGEGTPEELQARKSDLLGQYYQQRNNEQLKRYFKKIGECKALELRRALINTLADIMKERYSQAAAAALKNIYPQFEFTESSIQDDLKKVGAGEISKTIAYDRLVKEISEEEKKQQGTITGPERRHKEFINRLMDINKSEGVKYDLQTMTVLEYAIAEERLEIHIDNLEQQQRNYGR